MSRSQHDAVSADNDGGATPRAPADGTAAHANERLIRTLWERLRPGGDVAAAERLFAPGYVRHSAGGGRLGRHEFIAMMRTLHEAFPDLETTIEDIVADDTRVAYRWSTVGLHERPYLGVPATRRRIVTTGITFARVEDGLIAEEWTSWNKESVLHALGLVPIQP